jgi:NAD(P)-dependent dehydrogenase (short-subunit alcohol dehydrogenase family)
MTDPRMASSSNAVDNDHRPADTIAAGPIGWGLEGCVAVVLGAGPGIGQETARLLAGRGAKVVLGGRRLEVLTKLQEHLASISPTFIGQVDVTNRGSLTAFFEHTVADVGMPQIVIDVVGRGQQKPFADVSESDWDDMFDVNVRQQYLVAQETLPLLMQTGGALTFVGSIAANLSSPRNVPYGAAKAALNSLTRSLGVEYAARGVRVNTVSPGTTLTPRMEKFFESTGKLEYFEQSLPPGRIARAEEVAQVAVFVSSPLASFVTGQSIDVDGGTSVKYPLAIMSDDD